MADGSLVQQINDFLRARNSPLAGLGNTFVQAGQQHGVDPRLLVAISGGETSFGTTGNATGLHNAWGWMGGPGGHLSSFPDWQTGINTIAGGLRSGYIDQGLTTIPQIQTKWAPIGAGNDPRNLNSNWRKTVGGFYNQLGGSYAQPQPAAPATSPQPPAAQPRPATSSLPILQLMSANQQAVGLPGLSPLLLSLASSQRTAAPAARAAPKVQVQGNATQRVKGALTLAQEYLGTPYVWGGEKPGGFDCSGLLQYVWGKVGVQIPRVTYDQWKTGAPVAKSNLRPGDAVFFHSGPQGPEHVGMFLGGGKFIEAPHTGASVRISNLAGRTDFLGGRRFA